jgi:hypothetical protein
MPEQGERPDRPLSFVWSDSPGFNAFRGEAWMSGQCRSYGKKQPAPLTSIARARGRHFEFTKALLFPLGRGVYCLSRDGQ